MDTNEYEVIDIERKGNVIRFYLGKNGEQWGDDWNDAPYDCNAEPVYSENVKAYADFAVPFDMHCLEPSSDESHMRRSKEDLIHRRSPALIVCTDKLFPSWRAFPFDEVVGAAPDFMNIAKIYFGATLAYVRESLLAMGARELLYKENDHEN